MKIKKNNDGNRQVAVKKLIKGNISNYVLKPSIIQNCLGMKKDYLSYFDNKKDAAIIPISQLVLTRSRLNGIENAILLMQEASKGNINKRSPLILEKSKEHYFVKDGNSTVIVLTAIGCEYVLGYIN